MTSRVALPLSSPLLADISELAREHGQTTDQFLAALIVDRIREMKQESAVRKRAAGGDVTAALAILAGITDRGPLPGDEPAEPHRGKSSRISR